MTTEQMPEISAEAARDLKRLWQEIHYGPVKHAWANREPLLAFCAEKHGLPIETAREYMSWLSKSGEGAKPQ